jgi:hypothetical protein
MVLPALRQDLQPFRPIISVNEKYRDGFFAIKFLREETVGRKLQDRGSGRHGLLSRVAFQEYLDQ